MAAGDNEQHFRNVIAAKFGASVLAGKKRSLPTQRGNSGL